MKLKDLTISELYMLYGLTETYKNYLERKMRLSVNNPSETNVLLKRNGEVFDKMKMMYEEINNRLNEIEK